MQNSHSNDALRTDAVTVIFGALDTIMSNAASTTKEAHKHSIDGERNAAIGTALILVEMLEDAKGLLAAALTLHRTRGL